MNEISQEQLIGPDGNLNPKIQKKISIDIRRPDRQYEVYQCSAAEHDLIHAHFRELLIENESSGTSNMLTAYIHEGVITYGLNPSHATLRRVDGMNLDLHKKPVDPHVRIEISNYQVNNGQVLIEDIEYGGSSISLLSQHYEMISKIPGISIDTSLKLLYFGGSKGEEDIHQNFLTLIGEIDIKNYEKGILDHIKRLTDRDKLDGDQKKIKRGYVAVDTSGLKHGDKVVGTHLNNPQVALKRLGHTEKNTNLCAVAKILKNGSYDEVIFEGLNDFIKIFSSVRILFEVADLSLENCAFTYYDLNGKKITATTEQLFKMKSKMKF